MAKRRYGQLTKKQEKEMNKFFWTVMKIIFWPITIVYYFIKESNKGKRRKRR